MIKKLLNYISPDDIFFVSYPKSGTTWIRFIIANYLTDGRCNSFASNPVIPDIHSQTAYCNTLHPPRMMKSHFAFNPEYRNVIYISRDPRDIAVSYYFHYLRKNNIDLNTTFDEFVGLFNMGKVFFGTWNRHVISWLNNTPSRFLLIRYEDVHRNVSSEIASVLSFLNIDLDRKKLNRAISQSSLSRMRSLEEKLLPTEPTLKRIGIQVPFVRRGLIGDYRNYFNREMEEAFIKVHHEGMSRLKYI